MKQRTSTPRQNGGQSGMMPGSPSGGKPMLDRAGGEPNALLQKVIAELERSVPAELKETYEGMVIAGLHLMFEDATHQHFEELMSAVQASPPQAPQLIAHGILKAVSIILNEVGGGQPSSGASGPATGAPATGAQGMASPPMAGVGGGGQQAMAFGGQGSQGPQGGPPSHAMPGGHSPIAVGPNRGGGVSIERLAEAGFPAAIALMCYAMEVMETRIGLQITEDLIARTTEAIFGGYMQLMGISAEQIEQMSMGQRGGMPPRGGPMPLLQRAGSAETGIPGQSIPMVPQGGTPPG